MKSFWRSLLDRMPVMRSRRDFCHRPFVAVASAPAGAALGGAEPMEEDLMAIERFPDRSTRRLRGRELAHRRFARAKRSGDAVRVLERERASGSVPRALGTAGASVESRLRQARARI